MVLVDTSIWINHLRSSVRQLEKLLCDGCVWIHPFIAGELACGNLKNRSEILALLQTLPTVQTITLEEYLFFIESHGLSSVGIGFVDVHLLAAARMSGIPLWTEDKRLRQTALTLGISYWFPEKVFSGSDSAFTSTTLTFDVYGETITNNSTKITADIGATCCFFITTPEDDSYTYYSQTSLNSDGYDHMLVFDTSDNSVGRLAGSPIKGQANCQNLNQKSRKRGLIQGLCHGFKAKNRIIGGLFSRSSNARLLPMAIRFGHFSD